MTWNHNHNLGIPSVLRWKNLTEETKLAMQRFLSDFSTPAAAQRAYENELEERFMNKPWVLIKGDRSLNPTIRDWYYASSKFSCEKHGPQTGEQMIEKLEEFANEKPDLRKCYKWKEDHTSRSHDYCITIQTEFMKRVVENCPTSLDVVYADSTASVDLSNTSLTLKCVSTSIGALPIAVSIHSAQSEKVYIQAFKFLKGFLSIDPLCFITDDSKAEQSAIETVFKNAKRLLCMYVLLFFITFVMNLLSRFHILQAVWRWLSKETKLALSARQKIISRK